MTRSRISLVAALFSFLALGLLRVPAQPPAKPPPLPPINPANARLDQTITGLDGPGFAIAYGQDADLLVAACDQGTIQTWTKDVLLNIRAGSGSGNALRGHQGPVLELAWNGGPVLASAGADRKIIFWSMKDGKILSTASVEEYPHALAMSPDGQLLASGGENKLIQIWNVADGKPAAQLIEHKDWIEALAFSPDSKQLVSGDYGGNVLLWDVAGKNKVRDLTPKPSPPPKEPPPTYPVHALAFSPDGKMLGIGGGDGIVHIVIPTDGKVFRTMAGHASAITDMAFHPTGVLVSASKDRTIRLWNPAAGPQPIKVLEGHGAWVEGVTFTTQWTRLASVGADRTVRLWDLADSPKK